MKTTQKLLLSYVFIFLSGLLIGSSCVFFFCKGHGRHGPPPNLSKAEKRVYEKVSYKLNLDEKQRMAFKQILAEDFVRIKIILQKQEPELIASMNESARKLNEILNSEQQIKLEKIRKKAIKHIKRRTRD